MSINNDIPKIYNTQLNKIINRIPLDEIKTYLSDFDKYKIGKTKFENNDELTIPYYYNFSQNIYLDILNICKKHNIYLYISFSPYNDKIYFLNNIPIIVLVNNNFELKYNYTHLFDIYFRYSLPVYYNSRLFIYDLNNYIDVDNNIKLPKLTKNKMNIIDKNSNNNISYHKYLDILSPDNYIITGVGAYNHLLNENVDENFITLLIFNTDQEFMKILKKNYFIEKNILRKYIFKYYYDIYDDKNNLIMRIFDIKKTPISTFKKTNYTNPHTTIAFLFMNYLIDNTLLDYYLAYNLTYNLKKNVNNLMDECFSNNLKINNILYIINNKLKL